jgi:hypothetical protein
MVRGREPSREMADITWKHDKRPMSLGFSQPIEILWLVKRVGPTPQKRDPFTCGLPTLRDDVRSGSVSIVISGSH